MDVSMYGLGSFYQMISMGLMDEPTLLTCSILTLVLSILVCIVGLPRGRRGGARGVKAFLNFDRLAVASIFKFFYVLLALGLIIFTVGGFVYFCVQSVAGGVASYYGAGNWALIVLFVILTLALAEVALRVTFELAMLTVKLVENVVAIKERLEQQDDATGQAGAAGSGSPGGPGAGPAGGSGWYGQGGQAGAAGGYAAGYGVAGGYDGSRAPDAGGAARSLPPEPVAVARSYAPEPPAAWQGEPAYRTQVGYAQGASGGHAGYAGASHAGYGDAEGYGYAHAHAAAGDAGYGAGDYQDMSALDADYADEAYDAGAYGDAYDETGYGRDAESGAGSRGEGATSVLGAHGSMTSVLPSAGRTTTLPAYDEGDEAAHGDGYGAASDDAVPQDADDAEDYDEPAVGPADVIAPASHDDSDEMAPWDCPCGAHGNTGNFCGHCGQPRPTGEAQ